MEVERTYKVISVPLLGGDHIQEDTVRGSTMVESTVDENCRSHHFHDGYRAERRKQ